MTPRRAAAARYALAGSAALLALAPCVARAQLGRNGDPLTTSAYGIDLSQSTAQGSGRVVGLGGAYVGIAEGTEGLLQNPASVASRTAYSFDHFDYDLSAGFSVPSSLNRTDFFNSGARGAGAAQNDFVFLDAGAILQFGGLGVGLTVASQTWTLAGRRNAGGSFDGTRVDAQFLTVVWSAGHQLLDGQLVIGGGQRITGLTLTQQAPGDPARTVFSTDGAAYQLGGLVRPNDAPWRLGVTARSAVSSTALGGATGDRVLDPGTVSATFLPRRVELPWELSAGIAVQIGRPLNPRWVDPAAALETTRRRAEWRRRERRRAAGGAPEARAVEDALDDEHVERAERQVDRALRERYRRMQRSYLLVSAAGSVLGPTPESVGVESFLERRVQRSGEEASWSARFGLEGEPWPDRLKLRIGTYREPARLTPTPATPGLDAKRPEARYHGTFGFDLHVFDWSVFGLAREDFAWRVGGAVDVAERYLSWSVSIGGWH